MSARLPDRVAARRRCDSSSGDGAVEPGTVARGRSVRLRIS